MVIYFLMGVWTCYDFLEGHQITNDLETSEVIVVGLVTK